MEITKFLQTSRILSHTMFVLELSMVMLWNSQSILLNVVIMMQCYKIEVPRMF